MKIKLNYKKVGKWLEGDGEYENIIISSRIRLARNIVHHRFLSKTTPEEQKEIIEETERIIKKVLPEGIFYYANQLTPLEIQFLLERHLVSPDFTNSNFERAVYFTKDELVSIMINEEDHLRIQMLSSGLSLRKIWEKIDELDTKINQELPYAYDEQYGFLTACPTNVGTGLRASILIHLPGLIFTKEIEKALRSVDELGFTVRGIYGEGTQTKAGFFQVSNQKTMGVSEENIIEILENIGKKLVEYEEKAKEFLFRELKIEIEDKIYKALGILKYARILSSEETLNLLSTLRLGIGKFNELSLKQINELTILTKPANLQVLFQQELPPQERDIKRASFLRETFKHIAA